MPEPTTLGINGCVSNAYGKKCNGLSENSITFTENIYTTAGNYIPKVIVQKGSLSKEARSLISYASVNLYPASGAITDNIYSIPFGTSTKIKWESANVTSCEASGDWSGLVEKINSTGYSTGNITSTKTYTITCINSLGASVSDTVTITVGEYLLIKSFNTEPNGSPAITEQKSGVDFIAMLDTNITGSEPTYYYWCDRSDSGTDITSSYGSYHSHTGNSTVDSEGDSGYRAVDLCNYPVVPGVTKVYTPKAIVKLGTQTVEARRTIIVAAPISLDFSSRINPYQGSTINDPVKIKAGTEESFMWSTYGDPTSCTASGDWSGTKSTGVLVNADGSLEEGFVGKLSQGNYSFTLTCSNSISGLSASKTIYVSVTPSGNMAPVPINLYSNQPVSYCINPLGWVLGWTFSDADNNNKQSAYQVIVKDSLTGSIVIDTGEVISTSNTYSISAGSIDFNKTYSWTVKVWDDDPERGESAFVTGPDFTTIKHAPPALAASLVPVHPAVDEVLTITDSTTVFGGSTKATWVWTASDADVTILSPLNQNIFKVKYAIVGNKNITLRVTDSDGYSCSRGFNDLPTDNLPNVSIGRKTPTQFQEITP